jgi:membrane protease YdiL (CAAX protease family)
VSTSSEPSRSARTLDFFPLAASGEAGLLLLAWGLARWLGIAPLESLNHRVGAGILWGTVAALPLFAALCWMLTTTYGPLRRLVAMVEQEMGSFLAPLSLLQLAVLAALAGFSEEVLFRGVLLPGLARELTPVGGLVASSLLFGLVHFASRAYAVVAGVMGVYLGVLFLLTGSLVAPIVSHAIYDFGALAVVARRVRPRQR